MSDSQRAVDQLFALLKAQVNSGLIKELNLAQDVVDILGAEGLDTLAKQYSYALSRPSQCWFLLIFPVTTLVIVSSSRKTPTLELQFSTLILAAPLAA